MGRMEEVNQVAQVTGGAAGLSGVAATKASSIIAGGAGFAVGAAVVILLEPQTPKEKAICFISTVVSAICLSSAIKLYYGITFPNTFDGDMAYAGLIVASGAPGWVLVRAFVMTAEVCNGKDITGIVSMVRGWFGK